MHGHELGSSQQVTKGPVQLLVGEVQTGPTDDHHVHRSVLGPVVGQLDSLQVLGQVARVEQEAPGPRVVAAEVHGGGHWRGKDLSRLDGHPGGGDQ